MCHIITHLEAATPALILKLCHAGHFMAMLWWSHEHWLSLSEACSCNECELLYYLHKDHGSPARSHGRVKNLKCESCSSVRKDLCVETSTCSLIGGNSVTVSDSHYNWNLCQWSVNHPSLMVSKTLDLFLGKTVFCDNWPVSVKTFHLLIKSLLQFCLLFKFPSFSG